MRKINIDFNAENTLPDGSVLGKVGEHNATELIIKPPADMLEYSDLSHISVVFSMGTKRVSSDAISAADEMSFIISRDFTKVSVVTLQLEGYDGNDNLLVKSDRIDDLIFENCINGEEYLGTDEPPLISEIRQNTLARHSHENKNVLDLLSSEGEKLRYNGKSIGGGVTFGSKYYANDWDSGAIAIDSFITPSLLFLINEEYPENRLITDVSIRWNNGEITDYSFFELIIKSFIAGASTLTVSKKPVYEETNGMYAVAQIANIGEVTVSPLYAAVTSYDTSIEGFTVHYIEI